ncbi:MAG: ferrous iron transport protein B [Deltaproteobacteria bacterium]|nr:ferrous iron transport protein B [Deltaproteobacteria bacterium]MBW1737144.1 ferrous iron transport protein B [Deltaproteobacteria bacterium]MBW1909698.1 ferrous iron transport protein B [Deltaproteobacteria bacterium]MBW2034288.1 ferrous iron transport protein B [Deltaproteobacteria bacterium]MBW2114590.1 ferrous iron transport protein B [Deltaproteobacteria bacterium]
MKKKIVIALSGNPNSGKTTVFNAITGARQQIANYPGVTVEKKAGRVNHKGHEIEVVDLPGTYSLTAYSLEEIVARDFLVNERPDLVVDIVDASNLDRNLYLAVQFKELGIPLIIALNMVDVAESRDIIVDHEQLSALLEIPVVPMVARSNRGIQELLDKVIEVAKDDDKKWQPAVISYGMDIDQSLDEIEAIIEKSRVYDRKYPARWRALKCLEGDSQIRELLKRDPDLGEKIDVICRRILKHIMDTLDEEPEGIIADHRYGYITGITKKTVKRKIESRLNLSDKIDKVLTSRIIGPALMIVILYGIYAFTFSASETPIKWFEAFFNILKSAVSSVTPEGNLQSLLMSGIIDGVGGVLGFVPLIMFMFFAIAIMEDSGYMARVAYMLDRVLRWFGLHGNSVMALVVSGGISGGCAVPGVMAARTLRDPKERIATLLVVPFMNCGAKLPVYAVLIAAFFAEHKARMLFFLTLLSWAFALLAAKIIRSTVLRGPKTPFVMELPPYRLPTIKGLLIHTWERTWQYIKKAGTVILGFSIILWVMMTFPGPSDEQAKFYEDQQKKLTQSFLASPDVRDWVKGEKDLAGLNGLYDSYMQAVKENDMVSLSKLDKLPLFSVVKAAVFLESENFSKQEMDSAHLNAAARYISYKRDMIDMDVREQQAALKGTIAGWLGQRLETITRPLGFDYRTNIALVGGFAAKEVVVSTLGTAYSLGEVDPDEPSSLSERLKNNPDWNPLKAFTLIIFTMLYVPCIVTVIMIRKESSWSWAGFSVAFNLVVAYLVSLAISQVGTALGLGV